MYAFSGDVTVDGWDRESIRVQAEHSSRERMRSMLVLLPLPCGRLRGTALPLGRFHLTVPRWMRVDVSGTYVDVTITGVQSELNVETVRGDVTVTGGARFVSSNRLRVPSSCRAPVVV